jgi:hypothetical protein
MLRSFGTVMAGLVPAIPMMEHRGSPIGIVGKSPAMSA